MKTKIKFFLINLVIMYIGLSILHFVGFILFGAKAYILFRLLLSAILAVVKPLVHPQSEK